MTTRGRTVAAVVIAMVGVGALAAVGVRLRSRSRVRELRPDPAPDRVVRLAPRWVVVECQRKTETPLGPVRPFDRSAHAFLGVPPQAWVTRDGRTFERTSLDGTSRTFELLSSSVAPTGTREVLWPLFSRGGVVAIRYRHAIGTTLNPVDVELAWLEGDDVKRATIAKHTPFHVHGTSPSATVVRVTGGVAFLGGDGLHFADDAGLVRKLSVGSGTDDALKTKSGWVTSGWSALLGEFVVDVEPFGSGAHRMGDKSVLLTEIDGAPAFCSVAPTWPDCRVVGADGTPSPMRKASPSPWLRECTRETRHPVTLTADEAPHPPIEVHLGGRTLRLTRVVGQLLADGTCTERIEGGTDPLDEAGESLELVMRPSDLRHALGFERVQSEASTDLELRRIELACVVTSSDR